MITKTTKITRILTKIKTRVGLVPNPDHEVKKTKTKT
jgi:hypothetical protein